MRRREFITLLCGAAIMTPFAAGAQQATKPPTVGFFPRSPRGHARSCRGNAERAARGRCVAASQLGGYGRGQPAPSVARSTRTLAGRAVGEQDHGGVPVSIPVVAGRLHQPLDLPLGEVQTSPAQHFLAGASQQTSVGWAYWEERQYTGKLRGRYRCRITEAGR